MSSPLVLQRSPYQGLLPKIHGSGDHIPRPPESDCPASARVSRQSSYSDLDKDSPARQELRETRDRARLNSLSMRFIRAAGGDKSDPAYVQSVQDVISATLAQVRKITPPKPMGQQPVPGGKLPYLSHSPSQTLHEWGHQDPVVSAHPPKSRRGSEDDLRELWGKSPLPVKSYRVVPLSEVREDSVVSLPFGSDRASCLKTEEKAKRLLEGLESLNRTEAVEQEAEEREALRKQAVGCLTQLKIEKLSLNESLKRNRIEMDYQETQSRLPIMREELEETVRMQESLPLLTTARLGEMVEREKRVRREIETAQVIDSRALVEMQESLDRLALFECNPEIQSSIIKAIQSQHEYEQVEMEAMGGFKVSDSSKDVLKHNLEPVLKHKIRPYSAK